MLKFKCFNFYHDNQASLLVFVCELRGEFFLPQIHILLGAISLSYLPNLYAPFYKRIRLPLPPFGAYEVCELKCSNFISLHLICLRFGIWQYQEDLGLRGISCLFPFKYLHLMFVAGRSVRNPTFLWRRIPFEV